MAENDLTELIAKMNAARAALEATIQGVTASQGAAASDAPEQPIEPTPVLNEEQREYIDALMAASAEGRIVWKVWPRLNESIAGYKDGHMIVSVDLMNWAGDDLLVVRVHLWDDRRNISTSFNAPRSEFESAIAAASDLYWYDVNRKLSKAVNDLRGMSTQPLSDATPAPTKRPWWKFWSKPTD